MKRTMPLREMTSKKITMTFLVISLLLITALTLPFVGVVEAQDRDPRMDVVFVIDTTGSMGDEIAVVKDSIVDMIAEIEGGDPKPDVRFGLLLYRDRGDEYITKLFELTTDTDSIIMAIRDIEATGGGDTPESVNEALHVAISDMNWDKDINTLKTIFLIGDARPKIYDNDYRWQDEIKVALDRYIIINTIGASGLSSEGVDIFTGIAKGSEGTFRFLTYRTDYVNEDGTTGSMMMAGGEYYEMEESVDEDYWKIGADRAEDKGLASKTDAPATTETGGRYEMAEGEYMGAPSDMENNLDSILTAGIKEKMISRGVKYGDTVGFEVVYSGTVSPIDEDREFTTRDGKELLEFLSEFGVNDESLSGIDLEKTIVLGFVSNKGDSFGEISVEEVTIEGDVINVMARGIPGKENSSSLILITVPVKEKMISDFYFMD